MHSVMIVDDEEPVLESYAFMIQQDAPELRLVARARTGFEAVSLANQTRPDIVVMDIGIPGIDGLDAIAELQKSHPDTVFILSTAYERFDLAQRAIPLGVFAYLVKPISRKTFLETLAGARSSLEDRRRQAADRLARAGRSLGAVEVAARNLLLLCTWKSLDQEEWGQFRSLLSLSSDYAYLFLLFYAGAGRSGFYDEVVQILSRRYQCISGAYGELHLVLVTDVAGAAGAEGALRDAAVSAAGRRDPGGGDRTWAIGAGSRRRYDELYRSFEDALASLPERQAAGRADHRDTASRLRGALARGEGFDVLKGIFEDYHQALVATETPAVVKGRIIALFTLVASEVDEISGDPVREIMSLESPDALSGWASRTLRHLAERRADRRDRHLPGPLFRAVERIEREFAEPLQLSTIAEDCGVSAGYLSRLFSEHLATGFVDYLNSVRITAAEERLARGGMSVKEVAYAVGYHDPNYFSRIFKKYRGTSPTSFLTERLLHED